MTVSGRHLAKCLLNKRATEDVNGQPAVPSSGDSGGSSSAARGHVIAAARLLPLPWDAALGYGNPKREVFAEFSGYRSSISDSRFLHQVSKISYFYFWRDRCGFADSARRCPPVFLSSLEFFRHEEASLNKFSKPNIVFVVVLHVGNRCSLHPNTFLL